MPFEDEDTRKVQTAVIGQADSDWPVFLPYDHDDFDRFMRGRTRDDFYCGVLLGGCGRKLTPKRYTEKKCHFAHRPPVHCRRTETGEASADHLYIGQALRRWLLRQGYQDAEVTYLEPGSVHGGAVEVRFGQGRSRLVRVQLARLTLREWQETRERLADRHTHVHWAYGPYCGLSHNEVDAAGYALRVSCRTERETREVYVGTQYPDNSLAWSGITECHMSDDGIITPRLEAEPPASSTPVPIPTPVAFPLAPGTVAFTAATELPAPRPHLDGTAIRLYEAEVQPIGSAVVRARISLPHAHPAPPPHQLHVIYSSAHLVPLTEVAPSEPAWLIRADGASPLPQQTDARWPGLRPGSPPPAPPPPTLTPNEPSASTRRSLPLDEAETVHVLRSRLDIVARAHDLIDWETLLSHAGAAPGDITLEERVRLLTAVDHPRAVGKPVLSALVTSAIEPDAPAPHFAKVLAGLGWRSDLSESRVTEIWERERKTAYTLALAGPTPAREQPSTGPPKTETGNDQILNEERLVARIREHLEVVARSHGIIKWSTLLKKQRVSPSTLSDQDRVRLLVAVDRSYAPGRRMLSALVKADGQTPGPAPFFGDVLAQLGWKPDAAVPTVEAAWREAMDHAYARGSQAVPATGTTSADRATAADRVRWSKLGTTKAAVVVAVRRALIDAARRQVCVGWHTLAAAAGLKPTELTDRAREAILVSVDSPPVYGVLLSSLVVASEHTPVPYFDSILKHVGRPHGLRPIELGQLRKTEQARAFAAYSAAADTTEGSKERT
ncbi:competence protein CoiA family protein [Streptomyces resistomycificus]|uniref:competence protein CoiA family protein n=2 Tax=Streptomyces resistomycificus TaxID=67356 RepID=UPI00069DCF1B|nr:competence protein CoiA family protein [Streptomyces resistomycificus]KUO00715.1 hypothetical protein AQJ84_06870 [Streptomyces resistomycificus]